MTKAWISFAFILASILTTMAQQADWNKFELENGLTNFRTVYHEKSSNRLYMGGVNNLYEFDSRNISQPIRVLPWNPDTTLHRTCLNFKTDVMLCQNNVGVLQPVNETHLYACGTMAYSPVCTYVRKDDFTFESVVERGRWKTPYNPYVSTVSVIANETLFTATQDSMQGNNGIISRTLNGVTLRTQESDKYWLNDPVFIGGSHVRFVNPLHDKVMVFFREKAEEFQPYRYGLASSPSTRNVVSRVATVCVNDHGGSAWVLNRQFATYQKMSIVCTSTEDNSETAFRYTHLESTFELQNDNDPLNPTIFGLFTTSKDAVSGTAVCAFTMMDLIRSISRNRYWERRPEGEILATEYNGELFNGPGMCVDETRNLSQSRLTFSKQHPIKFGTVYPSSNTPFYAEPATRYKHIVVHKISRENSSLSDDVTVIFMITMEGRLKRVVHSDSNPRDSWTLPDIQAVTLAANECVINLEIGQNDIFVVTNRSVTQVPLAACSLYQDCNACKLARDPYCLLSYDETCVSVFNYGPVQLESLSTFEIICSNYTPPTTPHSGDSLLVQLQANLSFLIQQNAQARQNVADLTVDRDQKAQEHGACSQNLQSRMETELRLNGQVNNLRRTLDATRENRTAIQNQLSKCQTGELWYAEQIRGLTEEVNSRPSRSEFERTIDVLKSHRTRAVMAARSCEDEKENITLRASDCFSSLQITESMIEETNESCWRQKEREVASLKAQLQSYRGQQDCRNNGWFQSNATGNRFLLGKVRSNWENAKRFCQGHDARLAIFRNEEELRYINNVIRAFEPSRNFWIGIVKNVDGSLTWLDGTPVTGRLRNRFPESQRARMRKRSKYCVEINPYQRWILTPCQRIRRPLCQRVSSGSRRTVGVVTVRTQTTSYRKYAT